MRNRIFIALILLTLAACVPALPSVPTVDPTHVQSTALAAAWTNLRQTQTALPSVTPTPPPLLDSIPSFQLTSPTALPFPTSTRPSPYEADHEAIRQVIAAYFDKIYAMHQTFQIEPLDDVLSTSPEANGFRQSVLREQALEITGARQYLARYAWYRYSLEYSEIVVFDAGQRARANFTEGNQVVYDLSIPSGIVSHMSGVKHIMILLKEPDGWKIIYDVHDDQSHRSLYAPTPLPQITLNALDKRLLPFTKGQGGPALPPKGNSFIPSDPAQLEKWRDYETALAETLLPQYPRRKVLCEWELTEKSAEKLNAWAYCLANVTSPETGPYYFPVASLPAVIHLDPQGDIQSVEVPGYGEQYESDVRRLFPNGPWKDLPNVGAMEKHLHWRRTHPAEPPLVVLNATAILTPTVAPTP